MYQALYRVWRPKTFSDMVGQTSIVRTLRNQVTREYLKKEQEGASFEELEMMTVGGLRRAVQEGDVKKGSVMSGQIAGMIKKEQTCKEMIQELMSEADALLGGSKVWVR